AKPRQLPSSARAGEMSETSSSQRGTGRVSSHANRKSAPAARAPMASSASVTRRNGSGYGASGAKRLRAHRKKTAAASPPAAAVAERSPIQRTNRAAIQAGSGSRSSAGRIASTLRTATTQETAAPKQTAARISGRAVERGVLTIPGPPARRRGPTHGPTRRALARRAAPPLPPAPPAAPRETACGRGDRGVPPEAPNSSEPS